MMQAMVDHVTGMVYWVPTDQSAAAPMPPVVMQPTYRLLRPVMATTQQAQQQAQPAAAMGVPVEMNTTVFVRGIPREATTQSVESFFTIYGEVVSCHVIRHKDASTNKGIAFVKFRDATSAQRAINCNHPGVMERREIFAEWAHPRPATSAHSPLPDQHVLAPPVFLPTPAPAAPAHVTLLPWLPYPPPPRGTHVLGFPAPHANYFPVMDYTNYYVSPAGPSHRTESDIDPQPQREAESSSAGMSRKGKEKET